MKHIISTFQPQGGKHCITNALKQILQYEGITISEAMLFGLASGISFLYLNQAQAPLINGRTKVFAFEQQLAKRLQLNLQCKSTSNPDKARRDVQAIINQDHPVLLYVDMAYLPYLHLPSSSHFGGHAIVLFGYDEEGDCYYVSDRDQRDATIPTPKGLVQEDTHVLSYAQLMQARSSKFPPFPAKNKYLVIDTTCATQPREETIKEAIQQACAQMLYPQANLLGLRGIQKFSKEISTWKKFSDEKLQRTAQNNYFQISSDGGTGGGIFRAMYGMFLKECALQLQQP